MDLDRPLDDLIKQKKNKIKKKHQEQQKNQAIKKQQRKDNKSNLNLQTRAKIKKPIGPKSGKSNIISRLSITPKSNSFTSQNTKNSTPGLTPTLKADPSQIIITKAISTQPIKNRVKDKPVSKNMGNVRAVKGTSVVSSRLGSQQPQQLAPTQRMIAEPVYERPAIEERSTISIRGRSNTASSPIGFSIKGESGPTTVLISGLDRGTNSEDVRIVCEDFGNVLRCEVLRNRMGESFGEAEVEFSTKSAALNCVAKLDNIKADGQYLRVVLRENKPSVRNYAASQLGSILSSASSS
ncbi:hypothetical protein G6F35_012897 [Rhizopus arrhizus]|nr:hypothetical protein G6F35_012897 [Rhizopus arrhizus]